MESRIGNDSSETRSRPKRVSFGDGGGESGGSGGAGGRTDDPGMQIFRVKVFYSEASCDGALKTFPQTTMGSILSKTLANRSHFVKNIKKKLAMIGLDPHTRLTLTAIPPVPNDRDITISQWLKRTPGAAVIITPENDADALYRQLLALHGQTVERNPLLQPDAPLSSSGSVPPTLSSGQARDGPVEPQEVVEGQVRQLERLLDTLEVLKSRLAVLEQEESIKNQTIRMMERSLQDHNNRLDSMRERESEHLRSLAVMKEVYRRMFLTAVREKVRSKLHCVFPCPPSSVDYLTDPYDKVITNCEEMGDSDLEEKLGLSMAALRLTKEDDPTRQILHGDGNIHIGIYADVVLTQGPLDLPAYISLFTFLYNQDPQTVKDNLIRSWM